MKMKEKYVEQIYAGVLAKVIGIRLGAPVEGWTYEKIKNIYGEVTGYLVDYQKFAADDDSNGPLFFLRALEDSGKGKELSAGDVAEALLNYAPYEHGFFWWGGYGVATEHTAYQNLLNGIPAPRSGSIEQNGEMIAEQIGGQIFIDTWGLVVPGKPDLAAKLAKEAASVTHDRNGVYGGVFIAVCISLAFEEKDIGILINRALSYIPDDCEYAKVVRAVMAYQKKEPTNWRSCYQYIHDNFGYDKYPGNCHIIPNSAVIVLSLLYGNGDFSDTINICNMCGWDTDCNVGNVATIMGVRNGLSGIDAKKWREAINDLLICSSVVGSLNIMDIPYAASYIAKLAYELSDEKPSKQWENILNKRLDSCHFEYPGSTHAMCVSVKKMEPREKDVCDAHIQNTDETAYTGKRSLKISVRSLAPGDNVYVYKKTYYEPEDLHDSRYDPAFSPLVYPGQMIHGAAYLPEYGIPVRVSCYAKTLRSGEIYEGKAVELMPGKWSEVTFQIPDGMDTLIGEIGFCFRILNETKKNVDFVGMIDDLYVTGKPSYRIDFNKEKEEEWNPLHREQSQFTRYKGISFIENGELHVTGADRAESYSGHHDWTDYQATFSFTPLQGEEHLMLVRVQGARRAYAFALLPNGEIGIVKNDKGVYRVMTKDSYAWKLGEKYRVTISVKQDKLKATFNGIVLEIEDDEEVTYRHGGLGVGTLNGGHVKCDWIQISGE